MPPCKAPEPANTARNGTHMPRHTPSSSELTLDVQVQLALVQGAGRRAWLVVFAWRKGGPGRSRADESGS